MPSWPLDRISSARQVTQCTILSALRTLMESRVFMNNIEAFNIAVAEILGQCYQEFPLRVRLSKKEIGETIKVTLDGNPDGELDVYDLSSKDFLIADAAVKWLIQAGYLWCDNPEPKISYEGVTLTPKGLEVLNAIPEGLEHDISFREQLSKGIKGLGKEVATTSVKLALAFGAKQMIGAN